MRPAGTLLAATGKELTVDLVTTEDGLVHLRPDWDRIVLANPTSTVFQTWEWAYGQWCFRRSGKRLHVLAVRDSAGLLRGIAPLWIRHVGPGGLLKVAEFLGTSGTDYLDFVAEPGWIEPTVDACLAHLDRHHRWNLLDLREIREASPTLACLRAVERLGHSRVIIERCSTCVRIPLPTSWEVYRASLGPSTRKDINYGENRLRRRFSVDFRAVDQRASDFVSAVETLQNLHQARRAQLGDVGIFSSTVDAQMNMALLRACGERGWMRVFLLALDGTVVAGLSGFEFQSQLFGYTFAINPDESWRKLSVGSVLQAMVVRWAIDRGLAVVDLSRGDEPYKFRFGGVASYNYRVLVASSPITELAAASMEWLRGWVERSPRLKRLYAARRRDHREMARSLHSVER